MLGVAEVGFVAPEDLVPVGAAGLDVVFMDEVPDDLFEGDAAGWEVEAVERELERRGRDCALVQGLSGRQGAPGLLGVLDPG